MVCSTGFSFTPKHSEVKFFPPKTGRLLLLELQPETGARDEWSASVKTRFFYNYMFRIPTVYIYCRLQSSAQCLGFTVRTKGDPPQPQKHKH